MIIQVYKYSASLQPLLKVPTKCEIHSIFDSTINIQCQDRLISLSHKDAPLTPMGINLDCVKEDFASLNVKKEDEIRVDDKGLVLNNQRWVTLNDQTVDLSYPVYGDDIDHQELILLKVNIDSLLLSTPQKGVLLNVWRYLYYDYPKDSTLFGTYLSDSLIRIKQENDPIKLVQYISDLLGAGEGLTPSGDDFICGVLAIWTYLSNKQEINDLKSQLSDQVKAKAHKTTSVSKEYLLFASEGLFNEYVCSCFKKHKTHQPYLQYLHKISTLGHSSGTDFLVGMYFGLEKGGIL